MPDPAALAAALPGLETPAYVYDLDEVARAHADLRAALPAPAVLYYSLKANPHPAVVAALLAAGCRAEVCSPGELAAALAAGARPGELLYTGPGKRDADLAAAVAAGAGTFSVDSPYGLDQLDRAAAAAGVRVRALLRVNDDTPAAGQSLTMTGVTSQFGADAGWVRAEPECFRSRGHARLAGFHLYMGSNLSGADALVAQFGQALATAADLAGTLGVEPEVLDLGGGFAAPFARAGDRPPLDGLADRLAELLDGALPRWRAGRPEVAFESGRYLVGSSGTLLTRVLDVKRSHGTRVVVLESGINHLGGMSGLRRLAPIVPDVLPAGPDVPPPVPGEPGTLVAGPLCTPLDTFARSATVPPLAPGQLVGVPNVGAYGLYASLLAFLGHPAPVEVAVAAGRVTGVSRLELHRTPLAQGS